MTTPAIEAKEYAAANGFTIEPNGRRYTCTHAASGTTFERGGYAALLNEMRAVHNIWTVRNDQTPVRAAVAGGDVVITRAELQRQRDVGADIVEIAPWKVKTDAEIAEDFIAFVADERERAADRNTLYVGRGVELDALGKKYGMEPRSDAETDASYRYYLTFGTRMPLVATGAELDRIAEIPRATREEIRAKFAAAAKRRPYIASFTYKDGSRVTGRFATYPEAVKYTRSRLSGPDGKNIVSQSIVYAG